MFITYGQQSNDRLLQYYGFVEDANPLEAYVIPDLLARLAAIPGVERAAAAAVREAGLLDALKEVGVQAF